MEKKNREPKNLYGMCLEAISLLCRIKIIAHQRQLHWIIGRFILEDFFFYKKTEYKHIFKRPITDFFSIIKYSMTANIVNSIKKIYTRPMKFSS